AEPLQPKMPTQRATVCSISNQLATTGCTAAGSAYDIDLPVDKIPTVACQVHGGRNGRLHNRRRTGLRKRLRSRAACSNRSGDSSADAKLRTELLTVSERWY